MLRTGVACGVWPGAVAAVGSGPTEQRRWVLGAAEDWTGGHRPMTLDTVFDVASLTKVLATLPAVLLLIQQGSLSLEDPVARCVPGVPSAMLVRHLLTHSSGLPAHMTFEGQVRDGAELVAAAARIAPEADPDVRVVYSDVGFILLGGVVRAVSGRDLPSFAESSVFAPLGMAATFTPPPKWLPRTAATEVVDGVVVHGLVHDENAAAADGQAGHAGVFATVDDVIRAVPMWFPGGPLLGDDLRTDALRDHTASLGDHRGLGWTCRADTFDILDAGWGDAAVSHTGFTGTSMAIDPVSRRWAVLLTNAVHYGRGRAQTFAERRRFHSVLAT